MDSGIPEDDSKFGWWNQNQIKRNDGISQYRVYAFLLYTLFSR